MAERRMPRNWYWDAAKKRWCIQLGKKGEPAVSISNAGLTVHVGELTYDGLSVGSLLGGNTLLITGQGTIPNLQADVGTLTNLHVPTLGILRALNVNAQGSIQNLNVPTLATLRAVNVAGVASLASVNLTQARIGGGGTLTYLDCFTGTIALAAIGTNAVTVATVSGLGSAGIAVGDLITITLKAAISGVLAGHGWIPTTNVVVVPICNPSDLGGGSLPAVGVDVLITRITKT